MLRIDPGAERDLGPEGYRLPIDGRAASRIDGGGAAGLFWGAQTLRQLLGAEAFRRAPLTRDRRLAAAGDLRRGRAPLRAGAA